MIMAEKFTVVTSALVYNENNQILIGKRSPKEANTPNIFAYPGGKLEFDAVDINNQTQSILNALEDNLKKEIKEETNVEIDNIEYLHSHSFIKEENGDKVVIMVFMAKYAGGTPKPMDPEEITEVKWINEKDIENLNTIPVVKMVYKLGFDKLKNKRYHEHIEVAGIVVNDKNEFLVLKEVASGKYVFPYGAVENLPGRIWEILEKNLMRNIFAESGVEIAEGMIPFTDREFLGKNGFEKILQFFICKYSRGEAMITDPFKFSEVKWIKLEDMNEKDFKPLVYAVYQKAAEFIDKLNN
jgi:ADP-ribose pyrophosphatase YjhB (NUDIX family)